MTVALAWSGGKDSCLALDRLRRRGEDVRWLFNVYEGNSGRVRFHGTRAEVVAAQARATGAELVQSRTHPEAFEPVFLRTLEKLRDLGARRIAFGNIHLADVRGWYEERVRAAGFEHVEPLWGEPPGKLVREFVARGLRSVICSVDLKQGKREWLGREFDEGLIGDIEAHGADACGEKGEYHSFVFGGPVFREALELRLGERVEMEGHALVDVGLGQPGIIAG